MLKKILLFLITLALLFAFAACKDEERVEVKSATLIPIANPADISPALNYDYYLAAEPLASLKVKMTATTPKPLHIVANLQELYGGENGYPQAVLVAKKSLVEEKTEWVKEFVSKVEGSATWLATASGEEIVSAVSAHMEDKDMATSLKAPLLSSAVLGRCGVSFTYAATCAAEVEGFLTGLLAVNGNAAAIPAQGFYWEYHK
jgi:ABC-type nitrate/sulfonate/bicarbonate transport system substrate-binding protein